MLANNIRMSSYKSKTLIDRTTPTVVVNQPYSTEGNGGRKLVRLDNGWLSAVLKQPTGSLIYRSQDDASSWTMIRNIGYDAKDLSVVSNNNNIYILYTYGTGVFMRVFNENGDLIGSTTVDTGQSALGNCSLAINKAGAELHACWSSKNSTYPNSYNVRYCKGIILSDGSVSWGIIEQVTTHNNLAQQAIKPTIVIANNVPVIILDYLNGSSYYVASYRRHSSGAWNQSIVYNGGTYLQSSPSACVGEDGIIHVSWQGADSVTNYRNIRYSKSLNGGISWTTMEKLTSQTVYIQDPPSITVNKNGEVYIIWNGDPFGYIRQLKYSNGSWSAIKIIIGNTVCRNPSTLYDFNTDFQEPLFIYQDNNANSVKFYGKWYE